MADALLRFYHQMPYALRTAIASARGLQLQRTRYGVETGRLRDEALAREHWTPAQWTEWQADRVTRLLHRAATQVPYYRDVWMQRRRAGDRASWELLANWNVLEKEAVRRNPQAFLADDVDPRRLVKDHTSGTSGTSLNLWFPRDVVRQWYALFEARWRHWYGVSLEDRWAIVGGQLVTPVSHTRAPYWVWNAPMRQLYMSSYHIAPSTARDYARALERHGVRYMLGYPSAMHALAQAMLEAGITTPRLEVVLANAEPVLPYQRQSIERAFGCTLRESYGMAETVAAASECKHGVMHLWPETGVHEVLDGHAAAPVGGVGDLVATGLLNSAMPLIRYRVGDRVSLAAPEQSCLCHRTLPVMTSIDGRADDVLVAPDGRQVGRLDPVFKAALPIREAQIIQETIETILVRVVPAEGYTERDGISIIERIRDRMGPVTVTIETCDAIARGRNGKFRAVISRLSANTTRERNNK